MHAYCIEINTWFIIGRSFWRGGTGWVWLRSRGLSDLFAQIIDFSHVLTSLLHLEKEVLERREWRRKGGEGERERERERELR